MISDLRVIMCHHFQHLKNAVEHLQAETAEMFVVFVRYDGQRGSEAEYFFAAMNSGADFAPICQPKAKEAALTGPLPLRGYSASHFKPFNKTLLRAYIFTSFLRPG